MATQPCHRPRAALRRRLHARLPSYTTWWDTTAIDLSSFDKLQKREEESGFNEKPKKAERFFRMGLPDQWNTKLTRAQIDRIVAVHATQMRRFGYRA